uniref:Uncharacterized protein n=1 Tax=viral metagenome TaxID=1070528 RepID=A0A6H1ZAT2_9ZZZZ
MAKKYRWFANKKVEDAIANLGAEKEDIEEGQKIFDGMTYMSYEVDDNKPEEEVEEAPKKRGPKPKRK